MLVDGIPISGTSADDLRGSASFIEGGEVFSRIKGGIASLWYNKCSLVVDPIQEQRHISIFSG